MFSVTSSASSAVGMMSKGKLSQEKKLINKYDNKILVMIITNSY